MTNRLPVLPPVENLSYADYLIYYRDSDSPVGFGPEVEREVLHLVTERDAARCAQAWQVSTWVPGRVYGFRKICDSKSQSDDDSK